MQVSEREHVSIRVHAGRRCTVCDHDGVVSINRLIAEGKTSNRQIAIQFELSQAAVHRHGRDHVPATLRAAIKRREQAEGKAVVAIADRVADQKTAVADEFLDDIEYSKRMAKAGVERCMTGVIDPETELVTPTPIDEFRLAPGFLASLDRANALLGQATGRLNQAPQITGGIHLSVILPRAIETAPQQLPDQANQQVIDVQVEQAALPEPLTHE